MDFLLSPGSYFAIFIVLVLTGAGLPIPEEVPIITAGIASANKSMNPWIAFVFCLAGALIGDCVMYYIGYHFGRGVLKDHRWWARILTPQREARIEESFRRHGLGVFFVARFLVGFRSPVYLTAGILRVSFLRFVLMDLICATVVVGTFFGLSYFYGQSIVNWIRHAEYGLTVIVSILILAIGIYLWRRHLKNKKEGVPQKSEEKTRYEGEMDSDEQKVAEKSTESENS